MITVAITIAAIGMAAIVKEFADAWFASGFYSASESKIVGDDDDGNCVPYARRKNS